MSDPSLRLPNTQFGAVLNLGVLPLDAPPLPPRFAEPVLDAQWMEEGAAVYIGFADGELHFEASDTMVFDFNHFAWPSAKATLTPPK